MNTSVQEIVLAFIDEALDIDDLENIGDYVRSVLVVEQIDDWEIAASLKQLHGELVNAAQLETETLRKRKLAAALSCLEADFSDYLLAKEVEAFATKDARR